MIRFDHFFRNGSYRLDTKMYFNCLKPVEKIGRSRYLYEYEFGKLENNTEKNYMC